MTLGETHCAYKAFATEKTVVHWTGATLVSFDYALEIMNKNRWISWQDINRGEFERFRGGGKAL